MVLHRPVETARLLGKYRVVPNGPIYLLFPSFASRGLDPRASRTVPIGALATRAYGGFTVKPWNPFVGASLATVAHQCDCDWNFVHIAENC